MRASGKLRGEHQFYRYISVFMKTSSFSAESYYDNQGGPKRLTPTQDTRDIIAAATKRHDAVRATGTRRRALCWISLLDSAWRS
ncbi:hypothetical protein ACVS9T_001259 [Cronobacter sakazakii]